MTGSDALPFECHAFVSGRVRTTRLNHARGIGRDPDDDVAARLKAAAARIANVVGRAHGFASGHGERLVGFPAGYGGAVVKDVGAFPARG